MVKKVTKAKIIGQFVNDYGKKYYLREIATLLGKPHQTIRPYIDELLGESLLKKDTRKNVTDFSLNFKNKCIYDYLVIAEKEKLIEKLGTETMLKILYEKLSPHFEDNTFVLFGSSVNKVEKESDIDLLVIGKVNLNKFLSEFQGVYNKKLHKIQIINLSKLSHILAKEIYKKHLILNNTESIVRFFAKQHEQNKLV